MRSSFPVSCPWGSARSSHEATIHFWPYFTAQFRASPHKRAGPNAAAVDDEGVSLPGKLDKAQHAVILLPDPRHAACGPLSAHNVQLNIKVSPHVVLLRTQAVGVKSLQAGERSADLAPVCFNC